MDLPGTALALVFTPTGQLLATSSTGAIRPYDPVNATTMAQIDALAPLLTAPATSSIAPVAVGDLLGSVALVDFENANLAPIGTTRSAAVVLLAPAAPHTLMAASLDLSVLQIDLRTAKTTTLISIPYKPVAVDTNGNHVAVAMTHRAIHVYDVRNLAAPLQVRESGLKLQTTQLRCREDGYAVASVDGRVAIEYYDPSETQQALKYAFKCHRAAGDPVDDVFPVVGLQYHLGLLYTAGNDTVCLWNERARKRIKQYRFNVPCTAMAVGDDLVAVACDEGIRLKKL